MFKEFKEFAFKGNLVDMAVGFILGGAFSAVVKSLVDNVFMPPIGLILGGIDFSKKKLILKEGEGDAEVAVMYGQVIGDLLSFTVLALVVFIVIKKLMKLKDEEADPPAQEVLLKEIRDLLKK